MLKNKIIYVLLMGYSIIFAILYNEYISALVVIVVITVPIVIWGFLVVTIPFVHVELHQQLQGINIGESVEIQVLIQNRSVFPIGVGMIYLSYGNNYEKYREKKKLSITLDRKSKKLLTFSMTPKHCGTIKVVCHDIRLFDYFQLFSFRKRISMQVVLPIFPQLNEIETEWGRGHSCETMDNVQDVVSKEGDDVSELLQIRTYRQGDRLQRVHWKLSFKKEEWMVKEFSEVMDHKVNIFVELGVNEKEKNLLQVVDALMETVLDLSYKLVLEGIPHYIGWYEKTIHECFQVRVEKEEDIYMAMTDLLQGNLDVGKQNVLTNFEKAHGLSYNNMGFYITSFLSEEIIENTFFKEWEMLYIFYVNLNNENKNWEDSRVIPIDINNVKESLNEVIL